MVRLTQAGGAARLTDRYSRAPLKIAKAFYRPGGRTDLTIMDASPGMMAGDYYRIALELGPETDVFVTNQSSTKVHPSGACPARQELRIGLGRGARLDYRPEPLMLYADGALANRTEVRLAAGSVLLLSEVLGPGRWLRGEAFQYRCYDNCLHVLYGDDEEPVFYSRQRFEPRATEEGLLHAPGIWRNGTHLASLYVFGDRIGPRHREELQAWASSEAGAGHAIGVSLTYKHGLALNVMGRSAWELQRVVDGARELALAW